MSTAYSKTFITYNGEKGKQLVSSLEFEKADETQKNMDRHDHKVIFNRNLDLTVSFVKKCVEEGYLDKKRIKEYENVSNILQQKAENDRIYDETYDPLVDFIYTTGPIVSGQYSEKQKVELCKQRETELLNHRIRQPDNSPKVVVIAAVEPKEKDNNKWNEVFEAFGVIAGKKSYLSRAKNLMLKDKVALSAFLNQFWYDAKDLETMAFIAHDFHKKGFFSIIGEEDWLNFEVKWEKFKNVGYEVRTVPVAKSSKLISLEDYFKLHP